MESKSRRSLASAVSSASSRRYQRDGHHEYSSSSKRNRQSRQHQEELQSFALETDYTSAYSSVYGGAQDRMAEPHHRSARNKGGGGGCCKSLQMLFTSLVGLSLVSFWVLPQYSSQLQRALLQHHKQLGQQSRSAMLSDFAISASSSDAMKMFSSKDVSDTNNIPQQLLQVNSISSMQQGAPEAKFKPEAANQQIDKLMRVNLQSNSQPQMIPSAGSDASSASAAVDYQLNGYIELSDNLEQCSSILTNPHSVREVVYWEDKHTADFGQVSQWYDTVNGGNSRYLTFEPDTGGFAAQRMVLEHMVALAYALGRTLVLPPRQGMRDGTLLSYDDFFELRSDLSEKYKGLRIVTMEEFLQYVALPGHLHHPDTGETLLPPSSRINWDSAMDIGLLYQYLRTSGTVPFDWNPQKCIIGYRTEQLQKTVMRIYKRIDGRKPPTPLDFQGKATPVLAPEVERLREFLADRMQVCDNHPDSVVLHIPTTAEGKSLLHAPFYSFFFFDDPHQDLLVKRMIRDHVRYNDVIVCAASRIIDWLRSHAGTAGVYDAIHIRGPSYEDVHSDVNTSPEWILHEIGNTIPKGATLYIATDHADPSWFDPLRDQYKLYFAADFKGVFDSLLPWYLEMVEQLICARSRTFVGTYYSSFSAYTNRLRGYYSQRDETEGYQEGMLQSSYYASPVSVKQDMKLYKALRKPLTMREFPIAWRDINHGVAPKPKAKTKLRRDVSDIIPLQAH